MAGLLNASLADLLPPNIAHAPNIPPVIDALDPQLQSLTADSAIPLIIPDIDSLNDDALDALALQFSADLYGYATSRDAKREIVSASLTRHMKKGTASAIVDGLKAAGIEAEFIPWWKFGGFPYTFRIKAEITGGFYMGAGKDKITRIITSIVNESKSARSYMASLDTRLSFSERSHLFTGGAISLSGHETLTGTRGNIFPANVVYYGHIHYLSRKDTIPAHHDRRVFMPAYTGCVSHVRWSKELCFGLDTMQELLLQFEQRIFSRIDNLERSLRSDLDSRSAQLDAKIDDVIDLLRWKDEE